MMLDFKGEAAAFPFEEHRIRNAREGRGAQAHRRFVAPSTCSDTTSGEDCCCSHSNVFLVVGGIAARASSARQPLCLNHA